MARERTDNHFFTIIKIQQEIVSRQRSQHTRLHVRRKLWFIASCFITAPAGLTESHTWGLVVQCEEHTSPASKHSTAEICILAPPVLGRSHGSPWCMGDQYSLCLQRDPQLGAPAGRNTGYGTAHSTFQLKQKGAATSQNVIRRRCILNVACEDESLGNIIRW